MEKLQLLIYVFLILWKFEGLIMQEVKFYNDTKTWKEAANFCFDNGGVLESNVTLLSEHFDDVTHYGKIWLGKSKLLTDWTYIRGCFYINGDFKHFVIEPSELVELECQIFCSDYRFYSIKGKDCYCIKEIHSFHRTNNCNCVGCYKVWEHQFPDIAIREKENQCIVAVKCEGAKLIRRNEKCDIKRYDVACDNGVQLKDHHLNYQAAAEECARQGSFIKWYPDNYCDTHGLQHEYWTSGTRHIDIFRLRKSHSIEDLNLIKCLILDDDEDDEDDDSDDKDDDEQEEELCDKKIPFFCTFGIDEDRGDIVSIPTVIIPQKKSAQSDKSGSIAAGTVTSMIVVIVVISVLILIHRRRLSNEKTTCQESQSSGRIKDKVDGHINNKTPQPVVYHEIVSPHTGKLKYPQTVNNIAYDYAHSNCTPQLQNVKQSAYNSIQAHIESNQLNNKAGQKGYEMAKVQNVTRDCSEGVMASNYCLAKPISSNTEDESDPYAINRDYDHLDNVKKIEDPITKVYDHLPTIVTEDPTYDQSNLKIVLDNEDYYDHFKIEGAHA